MARKNQRFVQDPLLEPFYEGVDQFCVDRLPQSPTDIPQISSHKIIADPVEGYSSLDAWEVSIIDTPLFQRLRGIRQLGLSYLVYPTLGYSRFEHVIGARARLEQLVATLRENQAVRAQENARLPTDKQMIRMRLAVLCHDIGHCLFSHVSERVVSQLPGRDDYPAASAILECFQTTVGRAVPMAEILSVAILTSPAFTSYLHEIGIPDVGRHEGPEKIAADAAHLILGLPLPHDATSLFLGQLMNSGLDIDKLDYMLRESLLSGISLGISLHWLMKKLFIATLSADHLPEGLRNRLRGFDKDQRFAVLALERGGQFAFEEFCVARLALHEKIYLHQKIRAAEAQMQGTLFKMAKEVPGYSDVHRWLYLKESLIHHPEGDLPCLPESDLFNKDRPRKVGHLKLDRFAHRQLLSRAFAFGRSNSIGDPLQRDSKGLGVDQLMEIVRQEPERYLDAIHTQLHKILATLAIDDIKPDSCDILVDPPKLSTIQQGQDTIHIEYPSRLSLRWTMPIDRIEDYYHRNRALGYVFAQKVSLPYVLLAAEKAAWDMCGVVCVQDGLVNKNVVEQSADIKATLDSKGFYGDAQALRPILGYLGGVEAQLVVTEVAERLASYESRTKKRVSPASVTTFVSQFPLDLQAAVLGWLRYIQLVRPDEELRKLIAGMVKDHVRPSCNSVGISPLGATTDSAYHIAYNLREPLSDALPKDVRAPQVPLAEALAMGLDCYVIFDDNTNIGKQALNIVAAWIGKTLPEDLALREEHVQALPNKLKKELLTKPVLFAFAVATENATNRLQSLLVDDLGFSKELVQCHASIVLEDRKKIFSGPDSPFQHAEKVKLRDYLRDVATTIFIAERKKPEVADARSLGNGGAEAMVVFPYNCPTMTIPALWLTGKYGGAEWFPLVERGRRTSLLTGALSGEDA